MMKSDIDIKDDIYAHVKGSQLEQAVSGKLCKRKRPPGSTGEDICISVVANENGQVQEATAYVNVYVADEPVSHESGVPDADCASGCACQRQEGSARAARTQCEERTGRLRELCALCEELLSVGRGPGYRFHLASQRVLPVDGKDEHVIKNKLLYRMCNEKP